jgi:hypothetical protein
MKNTIRVGLLTGILAVSLWGCGGGGGGGDSAPIQQAQVQPQPTRALLKLISAGAPGQAGVVGGIDVTLQVPQGVIVPHDDTTAEVAAGVVTASGEALAGKSVVLAKSFADPATGGNKVRVMLANANPTGGLPTGEFATMECEIAAGASPKPEDFRVAEVAAVDLNGAPVAGVTVTVSATMQ